jgi:hypothetical protein
MSWRTPCYTGRSLRSEQLHVRHADYGMAPAYTWHALSSFHASFPPQRPVNGDICAPKSNEEQNQKGNLYGWPAPS